MINIDRYSVYKLDITSIDCYLDENNNHANRIERNEKEINGLDLIKYINRLTSNENIYELRIINSVIEIHNFNSLDGTGNQLTIQIIEKVNKNNP